MGTKTSGQVAEIDINEVSSNTVSLREDRDSDFNLSSHKLTPPNRRSRSNYVTVYSCLSILAHRICFLYTVGD